MSSKTSNSNKNSKVKLRQHFKKRFKQRLGCDVTTEDIKYINSLIQSGKVRGVQQSYSRTLFVIKSNVLPYKEPFIVIYNRNLKCVCTCFRINTTVFYNHSRISYKQDTKLAN